MSESDPSNAAAGHEGSAGRPAPPSSTPTPPHRRDFTPRELVLAWCLWLLGSWSVTLAMDSALPAVRWMVMSSLVGVGLLWPMLRLCQDGPGPLDSSARHALRDWLALALVWQAVVWPLRVTAQWSVAQALWLNLALLAWALLIAVVIAWGRRPSARTGPRWPAMLAAVLLLLGEPSAMIGWTLIGGRPWDMAVSPVATLWTLSAPPVDYQPDDAVVRVLPTLAAAALAWMIYPALRRWSGR